MQTDAPNSTEPRAEPRRLGDFIRERRVEILASWVEAVRGLRPARKLSRPVLLDHIPEFLDELAEYVDNLRAGHEVAVPEEFPRTHAIERLDLGFDLADVVFEYATLRDCIVSLVLNEGSPALRSAEMPQLHHAIDQAVATSATRYSGARERTLKALDRVSTASLEMRDADALLTRLLEVLLQTTKAIDSASILLLRDDALHVKAAAGFAHPPSQAQPVPLGQGVSGAIARDRDTLLVLDAANDPRMEREVIPAQATRAVYGVPLTLGDELLGVALMASSSSYEFSHEDVLLFRTMASRAAALIAQSRLASAVSEQHALYQTLLAAQSAAGQGFAMLEEGALVYANEAFFTMVGLPRGDAATPQAMAARIVAADREKLLDRLRLHKPDATAPDQYETTFVHRDGQRQVDVEVVVKRIDARRSIVLLRDISERKRAEREREGLVAQLEAKRARLAEILARLREALALRDQLMGVLSHDLRQPLSVISMSAALLQREALPAQVPVLARMLNSSARMARMINDLLDYTRLSQSPGMPVAPEPLEMVELARQVIDAVQALNPQRRLVLNATGECRGSWDRERILQVMSNLLGNAISYGDPTAPVELRVSCEAAEAVLTVHNQGPPIPEETLPALFEPFRRGTGQATEHPSGLGLGLFIVREIVRAHGGSIEVTSTAAEGTTFTVRLPRAAR